MLTLASRNLFFSRNVVYMTIRPSISHIRYPNIHVEEIDEQQDTPNYSPKANKIKQSMLQCGT